jgi:hypothetical protein
MNKFLTLITIVLLLPLEAKVTFDRNPNRVATPAFKFTNVPSPSGDDAATKAKLTLIDGVMDGGSGDLHALVDGRLPKDEDDPGGNFYFRAGSFGGRIRMDLGATIDIASVNTYSWHPNTRGPQLYKLYAADGTDPKFALDPQRWTDPSTVGWTFFATVSTLPERGPEGGQYGVVVSNTNGSLGKYRYLLFDFYVTELNDDWGNTFYSEIDVIEKK